MDTVYNVCEDCRLGGRVAPPADNTPAATLPGHRVTVPGPAPAISIHQEPGARSQEMSASPSPASDQQRGGAQSGEGEEVDPPPHLLDTTLLAT